jgi:hypothetical protein
MELTLEQNKILYDIIQALPKSPLIPYLLMEVDPEIVCQPPLLQEIVNFGWLATEGGPAIRRNGPKTVRFTRLEGETTSKDVTDKRLDLILSKLDVILELMDCKKVK